MQKPTKKPIVDNVLEKSFEVVKDTANQVVDAFNPLSGMFGKPEGAVEMEGKNNHTQVDFNKLQDAYARQDQEAIAKYTQALQGTDGNPNSEAQAEQDHKRRHQEVKREEEEYYLKKKQEEAEAERQEEYEKQQQEQAEYEQHQAQSQDSNPKGKTRKNIMGGGKKIANTELPAEVKPGGGKQ